MGQVLRFFAQICSDFGHFFNDFGGVLRHVQKCIQHKINQLGKTPSPKKPTPTPPISVEPWNSDEFDLRSLIDLCGSMPQTLLKL
jgi:hypothetical protein